MARVRPSTAQLVEGVLAGDRRAVAQALTRVEAGPVDDLHEILGGVRAKARTAWRIGITGPPGVGKSTIADALTAVIRNRGHPVAILAVDPSSPFSGGALLGDRIRMSRHGTDPGVFIRSMASRGHLGGLALATDCAALIVDAAGFDYVIIETVGVGQSEIEIAAIADVALLALAPGMGDQIQAAKAGVMEVADIFVINKSDHDGADRLGADVRSVVRAGRADRQGWMPPIRRTVAALDEGVAGLFDDIVAHREHLSSTGLLEVKRQRQSEHMVRELALDLVRARIDDSTLRADSALPALARRIAVNDLDPWEGAQLLLQSVVSQNKSNHCAACGLRSEVLGDGL
jgi:LAO/AO transport system kinase